MTENQPTWDEPHRDRSPKAGLTSVTVHTHPWRMNPTDFGNPLTFPLLPHFWRHHSASTGKTAMNFGADIHDGQRIERHEQEKAFSCANLYKYSLCSDTHCSWIPLSFSVAPAWSCICGFEGNVSTIAWIAITFHRHSYQPEDTL